MSGPDPIPVYIGDDWSFAFTLREAAVAGGANGAPVDLSNSTIGGLLFPPFAPLPISLDPGLGFAGVIGVGTDGNLGLGITRDQTIGFMPHPTGGRLQVRVLQNGLLHTFGVFPLLVLQLGDPTPAAPTNLSVTDPLSGSVLTFTVFVAGTRLCSSLTGDISGPVAGIPNSVPGPMRSQIAFHIMMWGDASPVRSTTHSVRTGVAGRLSRDVAKSKT